MKKFTIKSLLIAAALCLGTSAWAEDTYTEIYSRVATFGAENIWTESDLTDWGGNSNLKLSLPTGADDAGTYYGLGFETTQPGSAYSATKSFDISDNSKIKYEVKWYTGNSTGRSTNYEYIQFGDKIRISYNSDYNFYLDYEGVSTTTNKLFYYKGLAFYNISVIFNTATSTVEQFIFNGNDYTSKFNNPIVGDLNSITIGFQRGGRTSNWSYPNYLTNITVSECKQTLNEANYTIKYLCGDIVVKDQATRSGVVGNKILIPQSDKEAIWKDGVKYIYVSDDSSGKTIAKDGSTVVTVTFREAETYSYKINATDGANVIAEIKSGSNFEGETISYAYSLYVNKEGTLYKKGPVNSQHNGSFELTENNQEVNLEYAATDITNVEYWSEAEDIEGMTIITEGNTTIRSSASASAYAEQDVVFTTLPAGKYKITVNICDAAGKNPSGTVFNFKAGESVFFGYAAANINNSSGSGEFNLVKDTQISIAKAGKNKIGIDYIYIQRIGDATTTQNVTVGSNGIATFTPSVALDFTNAKNIKAYTATVSETTVTLTETKTVAAGEGVIIKSVNGGEENETIAVANPATATEGNALVGTLVDIPELATTVGTYKNYILNVVNGTPGFYQAADKKVAAGKAYLQVPVANSAKALTIVWNDGETTGIKDNYEFGTMNSDAATFDLSGRKVANPAKGLYIKNGKKYIIK